MACKCLGFQAEDFTTVPKSTKRCHFSLEILGLSRSLLMLKPRTFEQSRLIPVLSFSGQSPARINTRTWRSFPRSCSDVKCGRGGSQKKVVPENCFQGGNGSERL